MDAVSGVRYLAALQLAREGVRLLDEETNPCKRKAKHLQALLKALTVRLEKLEVTNVDVTLLETGLREVLEVLKPFFGAKKGLAERALVRFNARAAQRALTDAEQRLQTCLQRCKFDSTLGSYARQQGQTNDDNALDDARGDLRPSLVALHEQGALEKELDEVLDRRALTTAEQRPQTGLQTPQVNIVFGDHAQQKQTDDDNAKGEVDEGSDFHDALAALDEEDTLEEKSDEVVDMLERNVNPDLAAGLDGQLGNRQHQAKERETAMLDSSDVSISLPLEILGEGQFGQVVAGILQHSDGAKTKVAIKRVRPSGRKLQFQEQQMLIREAESWAGLEHPNIVSLLGTCILENRFHLVMDKCDTSLDELLHDHGESAPQQLTLDSKEAIMRGIARGLEYLHGKGVIHCDLEPSNVLLSRDLGLIKLGDFGLAMHPDDDAGIADTCFNADTLVYMAPEVLQAPARWTARADVYSFAMIVWEVYHGIKPFSEIATSAADLKTRIIAGERPAISDEVDIRLWIDRLLRKCWDDDPQNRPHASEIIEIFASRSRARRSSRVIRELFSISSPAQQSSPELGHVNLELGQTSLDELGQTSPERVPSLVRNLAGDAGNLVSTLFTLRELLEQESDAGRRETLRKEARSHGILGTCTRILNNETDPAVVAGTLWVLGFALSGKSAAGFCKAEDGVAATVVKTMQMHAHDSDIQAAACKVVWSLAYGVEARNKVFLCQDLNFGKAIVAAMRAFPRSEDLQEQACGALLNLTSNDRNQLFLGQTLNVGKEIVAAMRAHPRSEAVQENACGALANLAINVRNKVTLGQNIIVGKEIVAAMRAHPGSEDVQRYASAALWTLAAFNDRNRVILGQDLNAGKEIVTAMRAHPSSYGVQKSACGALANFAINERNKVILGQDLSVGKEIVAAMRAHLGSECVQRYACCALWTLTALNKRNMVILGQDLNVGKELVAAMRLHLGSEDVQWYACSALRNLTFDDRNGVILGQDLNVGRELVAAMRAHPANECVQRCACSALLNLATDTRSREILCQDLNIGKEIVAAMRAHPANEDVQEQACGALCNLAGDNNCNKVILGQDLNVGEDILAAMRAYPGSEGVQNNACGALYNLAVYRSVRTKLRGLGALEAVEHARARYPSLQFAKLARSKLR